MIFYELILNYNGLRKDSRAYGSLYITVYFINGCKRCRVLCGISMSGKRVKNAFLMKFHVLHYYAGAGNVFYVENDVHSEKYLRHSTEYEFHNVIILGTFW